MKLFRNLSKRSGFRFRNPTLIYSDCHTGELFPSQAMNQRCRALVNHNRHHCPLTQWQAAQRPRDSRAFRPNFKTTRTSTFKSYRSLRLTLQMRISLVLSEVHSTNCQDSAALESSSQERFVLDLRSTIGVALESLMATVDRIRSHRAPGSALRHERPAFGSQHLGSRTDTAPS
jgi:hypothetical protein